MIVDLGKAARHFVSILLANRIETLILEARNFDVWSRKPGFWAVEF